MMEVSRPATDIPSGEITRLLERWSQGDAEAAERLMPMVYDVLHSLAVGYIRRERSDHTLQATAVINEAYMALVEQAGVMNWNNRTHFIAFMARVMRRVLVNYARHRNYAKRGGQARKVTLLEATQLSTQKPPDLIALDDALTGLGEIDPRKASLVEMRFFGGLTVEEAADALDLSRATAVREWRNARAWLYRELSSEATVTDSD